MTTSKSNKDDCIQNAVNKRNITPTEDDKLLVSLPAIEGEKAFTTKENCDIQSNEAKTFDDILVKLGEFGKYQKIIYFVLFLPTIFSAMHKMAWVFLGAKVNHRCRLPFEVLDNGKSTELYDYNSNANLSNYYTWDDDNTRFDQCSWIDKDNKESQCNNGWIYDRTTFGSSAVMEWNLVS